MTSIRLTARARRDLASIAAYTKEVHGSRQARVYSQLIQDAFERLETHPRIGIDRRQLKTGYRNLLAGRHFILYRIVGDYIDIMAIRHQSEDLPGKEI